MRTSDQGRRIFGKLNNNQIAAQIRDLGRRRASIIRAAPKELRETISARLDYMERWAKENGARSKGDATTIILDYTEEERDCGTGSGGFQAGNECGKGGGEGGKDSVSKESLPEDITLEEALGSSPTADTPMAKLGKTLQESGGVKAMSETESASLDVFSSEDYPLFSGYSETESGGLSEQGQKIAEQHFPGMDEEEAIAQMRTSLETAAAKSTIKCCMPIVRGLSLSDKEVAAIVKKGSIKHTGLNSWTDSPSTAEQFANMGSDESSGRGTFLVMEKPRVGLINTRNASEREVIRPPGTLKVSRVRKNNGMTLIYCTEDTNAKGKKGKA
jgi:hypothetical protein